MDVCAVLTTDRERVQCQELLDIDILSIESMKNTMKLNKRPL